MLSSNIQAQPVSDQMLNLKSGLALPKIGMGTWLTFNVASSGPEFEARRKVLETFFELGGAMIDSSPMYGRAEEAVGEMMKARNRKELFSATKIWAALKSGGPVQLADSHRLWGEEVLDLVYVHNLLQWEAHLKLLRSAKDKGNVRHIGLTTSHGRRHQKMEQLLAGEPIDAVQFSYNIANRTAENRLLPAAADNGVRVIINRPFKTGALFNRVAEYKVPPWAIEFGINSWAEYFLKFIISHPAVDCAIPATTQVQHMKENMQALSGPMPDAAMRKKMADYFDAIA